MKVVFGVFIATLVMGNAYAQDSAHKFSLEGAIGQGKASDFCTDVPVDCDDSDTSFRLGGSIMLADNVSIDATYINFGEAKAIDLGAGVNVTGKASALAIQAAIHAPIGAVSLFAKGGFASAKVDVGGQINYLGSTYTFDDSDSSIKPMITFGIDIPLAGSASLVAQYDHIFKAGNEDTTGETDLNSLSIGVKVKL